MKHIALMGLLSAIVFPALAQQPPAQPKRPKPPVSRGDSIVVSAGLSKEELEKEDRVREALEKAEAVYQQQRYQEALPLFLAVAEQARQMEQPGFYLSRALEHAATCYAFLKQWDKAESMMLEDAEHIRKFAGPYESSLGHAYLNLAYLQMGQKKWRKAEDYCREAMGVYDLGIERFASGPAPEIAKNISGSKTVALGVLGMIFREQGRFDEALTAWEQAYALGSTVEARPDKLAEIVNQAVALLESLGRVESLKLWRDRSQAVQQRKSVYVPPEVREPFLAGDVLEANKQYGDALEMWEEAYRLGVQRNVDRRWLLEVVGRALALLERLGRKDDLKRWQERKRLLEAPTP